ncbi:hypothetical protein [Haloarchaeobius iranensis]|uniref:hypothetical protein n=1 Tax=Haloarchaeobius iranensis TaxID=996166 RepID=UPI00111350D7
MSISVDDPSTAGLGHLFEDPATAVEAHLDDHGTNVAVVAEPFAGREVLLDDAEETFGPAAAGEPDPSCDRLDE